MASITATAYPGISRPADDREMTTFRYVMEIRSDDGSVWRGEHNNFIGALDCLLSSVGASGDKEAIVHAADSMARLEFALRDGLDSFKPESRR